MIGSDKRIVVTFRDANRENEVHTGDVSYKIENGCLRIYQGDWTRLYPLDVVQTVDMNL